MSDLNSTEEESVGRVDVEERGNSLRVASNTPHLISLGCGRLSTTVTIHPLQQGGVTLGSNTSCDIPLQGTGVQAEHCKIENSNGVVTLYPIEGETSIDGTKVENPTRLSQGSTIGIGRSNYLRFNHPAEANLMKSVLPNARISMAPIQFLSHETYNNNGDDKYEKLKSNLSNGAMLCKAQAALDDELDAFSKSVAKKKPPVAPRRMFRDLDQTSNSSNSDQEVQAPPKTNSIMSKVSKFEFYVKNSQRNNSKPNNETFSPKVFSSNSLTGNIPARDVLVTKNKAEKVAVQCNGQRTVILNENNAIEAKNCSYSNVTIKTQVSKIDQISKTFDHNKTNPSLNLNIKNSKPTFRFQTPSPSFNRNPTFSNVNYDAEAPPNSNHNNSSNENHQKHGKVSDENQRSLEQARIDEILSMCAEYEKQNSIGVPTTPTEKKVHSKIITNGSLPRGYQNSPNIVFTTDGCFRFDTAFQKSLNSPHPIDSPEFIKSFATSQQSPSQEQDVLKTVNIPTPMYNSGNAPNSQDSSPQNSRQFPITELSSPVMIRKIARNAQNSSNYVTSYDRINMQNNKSVISPYENVMLQSQGVIISNSQTTTFIPKSPNTNSPRTRIKTTYTNKNVQPQHFVFPSPPPIDKDVSNYFNAKCPGIEKQLSLTEDIPMIDDTDFANELEMRIARLKPENREKTSNDNDFVIDPLQIPCKSNQRNLEDIKRDLIADIPEFDILHRDLDENIAEKSSNLTRDSKKLEEISKTFNDIVLEDDVFEECDNSNMISAESKADQDEIALISVTNDSIQVNDRLKDADNNSKERHAFNDVTKNNVEKQEVNKSQPSTIMIKDLKPEENDEKMDSLNVLYTKRKEIMNKMKDVKTEIHDFEFSRKQSELGLDDFEIRMESLQDGLQVQKDIRKDEIEMATVSEADKVKFKNAQEERQMEMKEFLKKLEQTDEYVKCLEKSFSQGETTLEELRQAQEALENERKVFEDLEFQHLEKESEFYSRIAKEQNVLKNDPWSTCKKIKKIEKLIDELNTEIVLSKNHKQESVNIENPRLKVLIDNLSELENELCTINKEINTIKKEIGIYRVSEKKNDIENCKARIKSGDFSPPTSDDDDMNEIKDRVRSTFELNNKTDLSKNEDDTSMVDLQNNKIKNPCDQMSMSMFVETQAEYEEIFGKHESSKNIDSDVNRAVLPNTNSNTKEKKGFWERNFDSLTRLKSKDKKCGANKNQNIMSQSLNENMFYNHENIESDFGSFENNLRLSSRSNSKDSNKSMSDDSKSIKKNKDNPHVNDDKENVDVNIENAEKIDESSPKNQKHRYLKNVKCTTSDNKYTNKSHKIMQSNNSSNGQNVFQCEFSNNPQPSNESKNKIVFRKSAGDEIKKNYDGCGDKMSICTKIPSQDDIDRISRVTLDAPLFKNNGDFNSLGRKTIDSLRELERNRVTMLEQKGCQVIENEREKMMELKKRIQNETLLKWEKNHLKSAKNDSANIVENDLYELNSVVNNKKLTQDTLSVDKNESNDSKYSEVDYEFSRDSTHEFSSFEKSRNSQSDSYNSSAYIEDDKGGSINERHSSPISNYSLSQTCNNNNVRPLSEMSDLSSDNGVQSQPLVEGTRRSKRGPNSLNTSFILHQNREDVQRPLTRYLPIDKEDLNLRSHIESSGHQIDLCPHVTIDETSCRGYLHKLGAKFHGWSKRWFVFDRLSKTLVYYSDKSEKKPRGGAYFQVIEEVYLDHLNASKSPSPLTTFVIKTRQRRYYLMAPSGQAARIWIDVIFTGAQGYTEYQQ